MAVSYLLPCACGEKLAVGRHQAGQIVPCRCGASLEVPTFAGLARLEKFEQAEPSLLSHKAAEGWGARQRTTIIGSVALVAALALVAYLLLSWPPKPPQQGSPEHIAWVQQQTEMLSPAESWRAWETILASGLDPRRPPLDPRYTEAVRRYRGWLGVAVVLAVCGAAVLAAGRWVRPATTSTRVRK